MLDIRFLQGCKSCQMAKIPILHLWIDAVIYRRFERKKTRFYRAFFALYLFRIDNMARPAGFEPATYRFVAGHSIR